MSSLVELHRGQPPFDIPACLRDGLASLPTVSRYSRGVGVETYRRAAAAKIARVNRVDVPWQRVFYSQGSTQGLCAVLSVVCRRGDVVAVPRPGYPIYTSLARMLGLRVAYYPALLDGTSGDMDAVLTEHRPRVVILNCPGNPLGVMPAAERLDELYGVLAQHKLYVVADECYDEFSGRPDRSALAEQLGDRLVLLFSMSKSHAIPSWRMGYMAVPDTLAGQLGEYQELSLGCGNAELQEVASEGLLRDHQHVAEFAGFYDNVAATVRDAAQVFTSLRLVSSAGMYSWFTLPPGSVDSITREVGVALSPGGGYGPGLDDHVRVAHVYDAGRVTAALARVDAFLTRR